MKNEKETSTYVENDEILEEDRVSTRKLQAYAILSLAILIIVLLVVYLLTSLSSSDVKPKSTKNSNIGSTVKEKTFKLPPVKKSDLPKEEKEEKSLPLLPPNHKVKKKEPITILKKPLPKPKVIKGAAKKNVFTNNKNSRIFKSKNASNNKSSKRNNIVRNRKQSLGDKDYIGTTFAPTAAKVSPFDKNLLLEQGTYIGCSLNTRLISDIKGGLTCTISDNVYSANGNVLLIEKGSKVIGSYKSGEIGDGMDRMFVVWQEIRTPNNLIIPVFSGASDELGSSGMKGWVDYHYLKRFGMAIMISIINDGLNFAIKKNLDNDGHVERDKDGDEYYVQDDYFEPTATTSTVNNITNIMLKQFANIKPTLYKNQGDIVGIYVNRDIDFSRVYNLKENDEIRVIK